MRSRLHQGGSRCLACAQNCNFLIFRGEFFSDLGGNEMSASSVRSNRDVNISGLCCYGTQSYNWDLPWCLLRPPQPWLKTTLTNFYNTPVKITQWYYKRFRLKFYSKLVSRGEEIWAKLHSEIMRSRGWNGIAQIRLFQTESKIML